MIFQFLDKDFHCAKKNCKGRQQNIFQLPIGFSRGKFTEKRKILNKRLQKTSLNSLEDCAGVTSQKKIKRTSTKHCSIA